MASNIIPKAAPSIGLPKSSETCRLSIVDTTTTIVAPPHYLVEPNIKGHEWLNLPDWAYHIKHDKTGTEIVFDIGARKDWENSVPHIAELCGSHVPGLRTDRDVDEILTDGGVDVSKIKAIILSHWHFDHCGNLAAWPKSIDLLVGPKFKETFMPGYPSKQESVFHEADFTGRQVIEVPFSSDLKIGQFEAHDYFGDGSLYILNVPGHAIGHIAALVRTTPDTAVLLGGDSCHFTGVLRPSEYIPMPETIPKETFLERGIPRGCPCSVFTDLHPDQQNKNTSPFYKVSSSEASFYVDAPMAQKSVYALEEFDADPNILILIAHDPTPLNVFPFFPKATINDWKAKGWKDEMHWGFVNELPYNGKTVRPTITDGLYKGGKRIKDLSGKPVS